MTTTLETLKADLSAAEELVTSTLGGIEAKIAEKLAALASIKSEIADAEAKFDALILKIKGAAPAQPEPAPAEPLQLDAAVQAPAVDPSQPAGQ